MSPEEIRRNWLVGTTCAVKANDVREVMFFNETHIVLKHRSHAEYTGRAYGSSTCYAYARLYRRDELVAAMGRRGAYHLDPIKEWTGRINPRLVREECAALGVEFKDMNQQATQSAGAASQPLSDAGRHTAMHHTVGSTVESLLSEGNSRADLAQALEGAARALRAGAPAPAPGLLAELATWMHAAYDRPPQTPEVRDILSRLDAAVAHGATLLANHLKALRQAIIDHDATPELDPTNWTCKACGNWTPHWHAERHAHADDCRAERDCEERRATWKRRALAAIEAIEQNVDAQKEDPGSDSACLKRVVEAAGFAEHAKSDEDIIDYVARLARTARVASQVAPADSGAELLCDGAEAIAVEAFMHAAHGGHRDDLYKLPLRSKLREAVVNGPGMKEFIDEAGRKGWMSDTGREPRINLVMFAWRAALSAAFAGRAEPPLPRIELELPDGDTRTAKVSWVERNADGYHVCVMVSHDALKPEAVDIWRARFNTAIEGGDESKWVYVDGPAGERFVAEVAGRPGWEIQPLVPTN